MAHSDKQEIIEAIVDLAKRTMVSEIKEFKNLLDKQKAEFKEKIECSLKLRMNPVLLRKNI